MFPIIGTVSIVKLRQIEIILKNVGQVDIDMIKFEFISRNHRKLYEISLKSKKFSHV